MMMECEKRWFDSHSNVDKKRRNSSRHQFGVLRESICWRSVVQAVEKIDGPFSYIYHFIDIRYRGQEKKSRIL